MMNDRAKYFRVCSFVGFKYTLLSKCPWKCYIKIVDIMYIINIYMFFVVFSIALYMPREGSYTTKDTTPCHNKKMHVRWNKNIFRHIDFIGILI